MIILRQRIYAKSDYEGLSKWPKLELKRERNKIAKELKAARKVNNKEYTKPSILVRLLQPYKDDSGNIVARNRKHSEALEYAKEAADYAKRGAKERQYWLTHSAI